jgi:hypothetical protein
MIFKKQILFLFSLLVVQLVTAQGGATIKASVDKNKILIGEPIQLTIEAYQTPGSVKRFIEIDSIAHFEILENPDIDTTDNTGGWNIKAVYRITSFDSGHWVIPSFVLSENVKTDTIPVDVIFSDFDPKQDYHDIKDIIEVNPPDDKNKQWWWYAVGGGVIVLAAVLYFLLKKKKVTSADKPKITIDPYDEAIRDLERLQKEKPAPKEYYSKLTNIFRLYVFRKKGILSLQKTTDDLIIQLKVLNLDTGQYDKLSQSLRLSDFVKFAKYIPSADDDRNSFEEIKKSIMTIEKTETGSPSLRRG